MPLLILSVGITEPPPTRCARVRADQAKRPDSDRNAPEVYRFCLPDVSNDARETARGDIQVVLGTSLRP
jgi:hypothetical protein